VHKPEVRVEQAELPRLQLNSMTSWDVIGDDTVDAEVNEEDKEGSVKQPRDLQTIATYFNSEK